MARVKSITIGGICSLLAVFLLGMSDPAPTQAADTGEGNAPVLKRVMLSSGGVGYFEFEAAVDGAQDLELTVRLDQVDDVLKSIVIYDDKGGSGTISLPSRAPMSEIFRDLPFGPNSLGSLDQILRALKGAQISITGPKAMTGRIVSVQKETASKGEGRPVQETRITLMTAKGLQQFIMEDAARISFTDKALDAEVQRVLAQVAERSAQDTRTLTIHSDGEGARILTIGYVVDVPLWKSSYRLILPAQNSETAEKKARLQGWSILENASGQDWEGVELTILAGNPVTFRQALYANYYVNRPEVPIDVMSQGVPNLDEGEIEERDLRKVGAADQTGRLESEAVEREDDDYDRSYPSAPAPRYRGGGIDEMVVMPRKRLASSRESNAQLSFKIKEKVNVEDGQTLVVPIIDRAIPTERVAWFPVDYNEDQPLAAISLKNDSESSLPPGVLTVYEVAEGGTGSEVSYLGDARLSLLPKGEDRMVAYALDTQVTASIDEESSKSQITTAKIVDGFLQVNSVQKSTYRLILKAPQEEDRLVVFDVEEDLDGTFTPPKGARVSRLADAFRIRMPLKAKDAIDAEAVFEKPTRSSTRLASLRKTQFSFYAENTNLSDEERTLFVELAKIKGRVEEQRRLLTALGARRKAIFKEQERIRENLKALTESSAIKQRYLRSLDKQETELEKIEAEEKAAKSAQATAEAELRKFIKNISL